ncbi:MAG: hypothetical protein COW59_11920 [Lysobacterales bacterium CG17_big_fil_post_rev_8_21_14_2_50_64_11]|nr:MAG: hypothetical protein COW59_11920 [Xanthomonadales bacterium CG17_big_fil_post_rev_8_21_14_2_50_64_11]PIX60742.1 MAG: hypothetical protein COZ47_05460 [Xanthomonadales bacterium CG_4_10_14_3_um_filter_64_11]
MNHPLRTLLAAAALALAVLITLPTSRAATPTTVDGITTIHLDQYNGYFAATETLAGLKPGKYRFVVTNKAGKMVGFQIQDGSSHRQLDMFPLEPGQTRDSVVDIGEGGFRYRCPINPTPWYEVDVKS